MALTIKSLARGTLGTSNGDMVVSTGKPILVDNLILVNVTGTNYTVTINFYDSSAAATYPLAEGLAVNANSKVVLETITLDPSDKITGLASAASAIEFLANGVEKDL